MVGKYYEEHECSKSDIQPNPSSTVECVHCAFVFSCSDELACHRARGCESDPETNKCQECGRSCGSRSRLVEHLRSHDPTKRLFVCDICGHAAMCASQLKCHKFTHVTDRPFKCNMCSAVFKLDQHLKGHLKTHQEKLYECYYCQKRFRNYANLRQHMV
jgi:KRAB domain-containing zinc finger protein